MKTEHVLVVVLAVIGGVVILSLLNPIAMMSGCGYGMMGIYSGAFFIIPLLLIIALVLLIIWLIQQLTKTARQHNG